jgi:predicted transposase YbfD/YdcC
VLAVLDAVPDPRKPRGIRHQINTILALAVCAVMAGCRSFTAIGEWAADASEQVLCALGAGCAPSESTMRRTLQRLDGDELDSAIGSWAAGRTEPASTRRRVLAVDGKRIRGSGHGTGATRHLLAAIDHAHAVVLAQREVGCKTNEITEFAPLLNGVELTGAVVTADALHAQKAHADYLVLQRGAHYLLTVKGNQPGLFAQLKALPWKQVPLAHTSTDRAHGRVEKRAIKIVTVTTGILFPHARQAIQITRKTRRLDGTTWTTEVAYAVTSLAAEHATASQLGARPLAHREPPALGPRRHLRRRPLPHPLRQRTTSHGLPPQPRDQHPPHQRHHQHRTGPATSRMGPPSAHHNPHDLLKCDFAGTVGCQPC